MDKEIKFRIYCHERQMFWMPNYVGYTHDKTLAGLYSYKDALRVCRAANRVKLEESMVPEDE